MRVELTKTKEDPSRLVLSVKDVDSDMTSLIQRLLVQMVNSNPQPVGYNAVSFSLPEGIDDAWAKELKLKIINATRSIVSREAEKPQEAEDLQEGEEVYAITPQQLQSLLAELHDLRIANIRHQTLIEVADKGMKSASEAIEHLQKRYVVTATKLLLGGVTLGGIIGVGILYALKGMGIL